MKLKNILLLGLFSLAFLPSVSFARYQVTSPITISCGPYMETYQATSLNGDSGNGIRCVKFSDGGVTNLEQYTGPVFAWYGEGDWSGCSYRNVGQAVSKNGNIVGYASNIVGNGECRNGNFPGNLKIQMVDQDTIVITGAWNEEWKHVMNVNYNWMPDPKTCGYHFVTYHVYSLDDLSVNKPGESGKGLRCELKIGKRNTTWVGFGYWGTSPYAHLGTRDAQGRIGSSDFCRTSEICGMKNYGDLQRIYSKLFKGFIIEGWPDVWKIQT